MSRCFPFPPPGYEKKNRSDDIDLLKKEKRKEKKNKREKKDKEKKERNEKKGKDKDDKCREKKEKKEKHRDKKDKEKHRNKDKDKGKSNTSEEKRLEKLHPIEHGKEKIISSYEKKADTHFWGQNGENAVEDAKFLHELEKRVKEENGAGSNQFVEGITATTWKTDEGIKRSGISEFAMFSEGKRGDRRLDSRKIDGAENRNGALFGPFEMGTSFSGMGLAQIKTEGNEALSDTKTERKFGEKEKFREQESGNKSKGKDWDKQSQWKEKEREKEKRKDKTKEKRELTPTDDTIKHVIKNDPTGVVNNKIVHPSRKDGMFKSASIEENLMKRKVEMNGFFHENELRLSKMLRPASHLSAENGKKLEPHRSPSPFPPDQQLSFDNHVKTSSKGRLVNGFVAQPNQSASHPFPIASLPLPVSSTKPSSSVADQIAPLPLPPSPITSTKQSLPVSTKKPSISTPNQIVSLPLLISATKPPSSSSNEIASQPLPKSATKLVSSRANQISETPIKLPHPDEEHLSKILSVPKMEWSGFDDQEWLFDHKEPPQRKIDMPRRELQVWDEAVSLETADIYALPYVIPY